MKLNFKEIIFCVLLFVLTFTIYLSESLKPTENFRVTFFDVGQGDAALYQTPKNLKILVDGGVDNKILNHLGKHLAWLDNEIDMVVATHDDADHIFGLIKVLEKYKVKVLFVSLPNSENEIMQKIIEVAINKNVKVVTIDKPAVVNTDDGIIIKFLFPTINLDGVDDGNNASVVTQIIYKGSTGDVKILSTGDLGVGGEKYLVSVYGDDLKSNILKLGHHGSDTSTSPEFLQKVKPEVAIVSAGRNNKFGHPHQSVIDLLSKFNVNVRQTNLEGNIYFEF
jgi:competence protein ComEC